MDDDENPVCVACGEGPYIEEEWHLKLYTACANGCCIPEWYHVACFKEHGICPKEIYNGPKCVICKEGPYLEEEWHLHKIGCCENGVYHPVCTVELLKEVYGIYYWNTLRCPYCELDPIIVRLTENCTIM
jgi:hypothetical protein